MNVARSSRRLVKLFLQYPAPARNYFVYPSQNGSKLKYVTEKSTKIVICSQPFRFQSTTSSLSTTTNHALEKETQNQGFPIDIASLESSLGPGPPRLLGRTLIDLFVEKLTAVSKSGKIDIAEAEIDWSQLFKRCHELDHVISKTNFGGLVMNFCLKHGGYAVGQNYLKWENNPGLAVLTNFLRLSAENFDKSRGEEEITKIYKRVKIKNRNRWDLDSGERTVLAICKTKLWRDSFEIIDSMSIGGNPSMTCFSAVAEAAFENGDFELGWKVLTEQSHRPILDEPFLAFLRSCEPTEDNMKKLLEFMDLYEQYGFQHLVTGIKEFFITKLGYKARETTTTSIAPGNVVCDSCQSRLTSTNLSAAEFEMLQEHFLTRVFETDDLFMNTKPHELEAYKKFIDETVPFDFVVDGLNVAFCTGRPNDGAAVLREVVLHLNRMKAKILVIGRKHMLNWPVKYMNNVRRMSRFYAIDNESEDDPFMIWATLKSGPRAKFISNDLLRNHSFRLKDPELARLFKRWRLSHQYSIGMNHLGKVIMEPFTEILPMPQKNLENGYWHIPYNIDARSPYDIPKHWICVQPTTVANK